MFFPVYVGKTKGGSLWRMDKQTLVETCAGG